jgi:hypothetical protein
MSLQRRAIDLSSILSVILDLAMHTMLQEIVVDKVGEGLPNMFRFSTVAGVLRKIEQQ